MFHVNLFESPVLLFPKQQNFPDHIALNLFLYNQRKHTTERNSPRKKENTKKQIQEQKANPFKPENKTRKHKGHKKNKIK